MFDPKTCDELKSYVYALKKPDGEIFYVGKGVENRCYEHIEEAKRNERNTPKLETIREVLQKNASVEIYIVRHGLSNEVALEVEAALIDILNLKEEGGNLVRGHGTERGFESAEELQIKYGATELETREPLLLIKINNLYNRYKKEHKKEMPIEEIYNATRWCWRINVKRARKANCVLAVANGIVRGVFIAKEYLKVPDNEIKHPKDKGRIYFDGHHIEKSPYLHKAVKAFGKIGEANPIRYIKC